MNISGYDIQPILLYLPDTEKWRNRWEEGKKHFAEQGIENIISIPGIYGEGFGIQGTHLYEYDNPGGKHQIGVANTALHLSMHTVYVVENNLPHPYYMFLEDDARFKPGWRPILEEALREIPSDFDFLFVGHCCSGGISSKKVGRHLHKYTYKEGVYMNYPLCGHCYIVAKKAIPKFLETQRDSYTNVDINIAVNTLKYLNVYAILPRIVEQFQNEHLPQ